MEGQEVLELGGDGIESRWREKTIGNGIKQVEHIKLLQWFTSRRTVTVLPLARKLERARHNHDAGGFEIGSHQAYQPDGHAALLQGNTGAVYSLNTATKSRSPACVHLRQSSKSAGKRRKCHTTA